MRSNNKGNEPTVDGIVDLYNHDFTCTFRIPRESVLHLPAQRLNITRLVACKNFSDAVNENGGAKSNDEQWCLDACKMGNRCKFVHVSRPLSEFPRQALHAHYIWRSVEDVTYERLFTGSLSEAPILNLKPCRVCAIDLDATFTTMTADASSTSPSRSSGSLESVGAALQQADTATATTQEGGAAGTSSSSSKSSNSNLGSTPMLDVVTASLSSLNIPATRLLKTFGATRALNSIRDEASTTTNQQQHPLQTCYVFACNNECKKGPDCEDAHVVNIDPTLEVAFVRRSMRHVRAAVMGMLRGPPYGALKPSARILKQLQEDNIVISQMDLELADAAGAADPAAFARAPPPPPPPLSSPLNEASSSNNHAGSQTGSNTAGATATISSKSSVNLPNKAKKSSALNRKTARGETPQYTPYPNNPFISANPMQALVSGACDFVVQQQQQQPPMYTQQQYTPPHHLSTPNYVQHLPPPLAPQQQQQQPSAGGFCLQYPAYMLTTENQPGHQLYMGAITDPISQQNHNSRQEEHQDIRRGDDHHHYHRLGRIVDDVVGGDDEDTMAAPTATTQQQQQSWSPFNSNMNWQHQQVVAPSAVATSSPIFTSSQHQSQQQPPPTTVIYSLPFPFNAGPHQQQFAAHNHTDSNMGRLQTQQQQHLNWQQQQQQQQSPHPQYVVSGGGGPQPPHHRPAPSNHPHPIGH